MCLLNYELERLWQETEVTEFEVMSRYSLGGTEKIREESAYDSVCPSQDSKRARRTQKREMLWRETSCLA